MRAEQPATPEEAAEVLRSAAAEGHTVRPRGGGTKLGWGRPGGEPDIELSTKGLGRIVEHNAADLTAVLEAGVALAEAQAAFAEAGQMLALDPPLGPGDDATIGGVVATADSGPRRHRYGAPRDLILGVAVALPDGTVARAGGKVIKNVAGYDLAKLFSGSFGTLGVVCEVAVRLHPVPPGHATVVATADDPDALQGASSALAHAPLELECLDVAWVGGSGRVLARFGGAAAEGRAAEALARVGGLHAGVVTDDGELWERQRGRQRSAQGVVVRVSALPTDLARVFRAADRVGGSVVGRAAAGALWITLPPASTAEAVGRIEDLRRELSPRPCVVLDAPVEVRGKVEVWGQDPEALGLMRRVKARFDPAGVCNPGIYVGGI